MTCGGSVKDTCLCIGISYYGSSHREAHSFSSQISLESNFAKSLIHFNPLKSDSSTHPGEPPSLSPDGAGGVVKLKQFFTKLLEKKIKLAKLGTHEKRKVVSFPFYLTFLDRASQFMEACHTMTWELSFCCSTALADLVWGWLGAGGHGREGAHRGGLLPQDLSLWPWSSQTLRESSHPRAA